MTFSNTFYKTLFISLVVALIFYLFVNNVFYHKAVGADGEHVARLSFMMEDLDVFEKAFTAIAIPRVVGTAGHKTVQKYLKDTMSDLGWTIFEDSFTDSTPMGVLPFNNIIATQNPKAKRFLDLACHYDSKYFPNFEFIGAMDSAAPCAMMIQLASKLNPLLKSRQQNEISLRYIFFDGEEAFDKWSDTDSLYGARHLAARWEREPYQEGGKGANQLDRMDLLVLLDLLGPKNPLFHSFFTETVNWYKQLVTAETKLSKFNFLRGTQSPYFRKMSTPYAVEDDHIPFLRRHVPILHLIPVGFPRQWHTKDDTNDIIDRPTVSNLVKILAIFISEYLHLID